LRKPEKSEKMAVTIKNGKSIDLALAAPCLKCIRATTVGRMDDEKSGEGQRLQLAAESLVMPKSSVSVKAMNVNLLERESFLGVSSLVAVGFDDLTHPHVSSY
jgi:hypothetical protein